MCFSHTTDSLVSFTWNIVCMCKSSYFRCHHPLLFLGGFSTEPLGYSQDWVKPMWIHPLLLRVGELPQNGPPQLWPVTSGFWINRYEMSPSDSFTLCLLAQTYSKKLALYFSSLWAVMITFWGWYPEGTAFTRQTINWTVDMTLHPTFTGCTLAFKPAF